MKLFVYGTLRFQEENNNILTQHGTFLQTYRTTDNYIMITQPYTYFPFLISPSLWPEEAHHAVSIIGDVYEVTNEGILLCDQMEGHPDWYCRTLIRIQTTQGEQEVWAYLLTKDALIVERLGAKIIPSGDWTQREE